MFKLITKSLVPAALLLAASLGVHAEGLRAAQPDASITPSSSVLLIASAPAKLLNLQLDNVRRLKLGMQVDPLAYASSADSEPLIGLAQFGLNLSF